MSCLTNLGINYRVCLMVVLACDSTLAARTGNTVLGRFVV